MNITTKPDTVPAQRSVHFLGNILTFRARTGDTGGSFSLADCLTAPGAGSPYHLQQDEEAFLVLEGEFEFVLDGKLSRHGPGGFVHVAAGTPHAFRNPGQTPSRMLIVNLPAGPHERFFDEVGEEMAPGSSAFPPSSAPDIPFIAAAAGRHGIELLPPAA
tara:strand:- start:590 stop:1069 length:480 start_codon:yes stop_codon:yes gene_type:complete